MAASDPTEEHFERGTWLWCMGKWERVGVAGIGTLQMLPSERTLVVDVRQAAMGDLLVGIGGKIAGEWQSLPMLWGYSDVYHQRVTKSDVSAGDVEFVFSTVPEGEVWVVTHMSVYCLQSDPTSILFYPYLGGQYHWLKRVLYPGASHTVEWQGKLVMKEDDLLTIFAYDCATDNDLEACASGYKMKIAE